MRGDDVSDMSEAVPSVGARQDNRGLMLWGAGVAVLLVVGYGLWRTAETPSALKVKPVEVAVTRAQSMWLPLEMDAAGHVVPLNSVEVRALTDGVVRRIGFREGQRVRAGQVLFELEVDDVVAELAHARAETMRLTAEIEDAQANLERGRNLVQSAYISSSALDALVARRKSLRAQMQAANANVRGAEARLGRATIRAPLDARVGMVAVREGARVRQADADPLVVLHQFDPIGVEFVLPERLLPAVVDASAKGPVALEVTTEGGSFFLGQLAVVDNVIDRATGTIRLRAELDNSTERLWPGAFVRTRLLIDPATPVMVVPPQSVIEGPQGRFVYRLLADGTVAGKPVKMLRVQDGHAVIEGLEEGDLVVVEGARLLQTGAAVRSQPYVPSPPASAGDPS